ncbi:MAG: galactose mutarotase [Chitinophagaceae bacterium]|nr:MAG: galactose mutarotase [Chitinophagaceae bacterium]
MDIKTTGHSSVADEQAVLAPEVQLYSVENARGTRLTLSNCGAAVVSLYVADADGNLADVVLGYDNAEDYLNDDYYIGTVVGRYANRIAGDTIRINDRSYKISTRQGGYHQHGGVVGFNKKIFDAEPFSNENGSGVVFRYTSPDLEEGFPGEFRLEVVYTLDDLDQWTVEYKGVSSKTTLVNLTQHAYFNLTGNPAGSIDDHEFRIFSQHYLPVNPQQVPTGELAQVADTPFDFTEFRNIAGGLLRDHEQLALSNGYDHSFVLEKEHSAELKHAVTVREPASGRRLDVYTTEPAVHFYTGNFLHDIKGKNKVVYNKRSGFCLETQHFPDSPNHAHFPSTELKAGEQFYSKTIYRFSAG